MTDSNFQGRVVAGRYHLIRELGRGGMGTVWLGDDQLMNRRVAVKELRPRGLNPADRATFTQRALTEARSAARIQHPGAVTVHDVLPATSTDDAVYLIMEYLDGPTLAQVIAGEGPQPAAKVAAWGLQLLDVLQAAHSLDIIHRDIKPANIIITSGNATLTDFGIAHTLGQPRQTRDGIIGTQAYMAPELFQDQPRLSPAADLWSLGVTLYAAAAGYNPFDRDNTQATLRAILVDDLPPAPGPPPVAAAITGLLQRDPARRATIPQTRTQLRHASGPRTPTETATPSPAPRPAPAPAPSIPAPPPKPRLWDDPAARPIVALLVAGLVVEYLLHGALAKFLGFLGLIAILAGSLIYVIRRDHRAGKRKPKSPVPPPPPLSQAVAGMIFFFLFYTSIGIGIIIYKYLAPLGLALTLFGVLILGVWVIATAVAFGLYFRRRRVYRRQASSLNRPEEPAIPAAAGPAGADWQQKPTETWQHPSGTSAPQ